MIAGIFVEVRARGLISPEITMQPDWKLAKNFIGARDFSPDYTLRDLRD